MTDYRRQATPLTPRNIGWMMEANTPDEHRQNAMVLPQLLLALQAQISAVGALLQSITNYDGGSYQVIVNNNGTLEWQTLTAVSPLTHWEYDLTTHQFQIKTYPLLAVTNGNESAWTPNPDGGQPVSGSLVTDVNYNTTTHVLREAVSANAFLLELPATANTTIDTAQAC